MLNNTQYNNTVVAVVNYEEAKKYPRFTGICPKCGFVHKQYFKLLVGGYSGSRNGSNFHKYVGDTCFIPVFYGQESYEALCGTRNTTESKHPRISAELEFWCDEVYDIYRRKLKTMAWLRIHKQNASITISDRQRAKVSAIRRALINNVNPAFTDLYITLMWLGKKRHGNNVLQDVGIDSSTLAEGHISCLSIEALNALLRNCTEEQLNMFRHVNNGTHIHADCPRIKELSFADRVTVFEEVLKVIEGFSIEDRIKYFGRDFTDYASDCVDDDHGCAINVKGGHHTVELRLAKIHDADQYTKLVKVWRGCIEVFNDNVHKVLDTHAWTPEKLGKRVARAMNFNLAQYQKGR